MGTFIIDITKDEDVKKKTTFTGYDYMIKFNTQYVDTVTYPISLYNYLKILCNKIGIELANEDIINGNYQILGNPFTNNETNMTVLSNIAQLAGGFAKIGRDNKVYIISLRNSNNLLTVKDVDQKTVKEVDAILLELLQGGENIAEESLDKNNYFEDFYKNKQWGGVNSLIIRLSDIEGENTTREDEEMIKEEGLTELTIADNYFLTNQIEREKVIGELWDNLKGLKYLPFKSKYYGYPYLDIGDLVYVYDANGNGFISYVFNHTFTYNGVYSGEIETSAMTQTQTAYKNTTLKEKFRQTEYIIDKINGKITQIVSQQTEDGEKLTQVIQDTSKIQEDFKDTTDGFSERLDSIEKTVEGITNTKTVIGGTNLIKNSVGYFGKDYWLVNDTTEGNVKGNTTTEVRQQSVSGSALELQNETIYQDITGIKNGKYFLSFSYKKLVTLAECSLKINDTEITLDELQWKAIEQLIEIENNVIKIEISSDVNSSCLITDLMLVEGEIKANWSQNANESYTDTVKIGKGIQITSTGTNTEFDASSDGIRIKNTNTRQNVAEFTKYGTETEELTANKDIKLTNSLLIQKVGDQTWFCSL